MIAKHVPMRTLKKSDFADLVDYITDEQNKQERLGNVTVTNCVADTLKAVVSEVLATQQINTRAKGDKTYHLLVSFPAGEIPSATILDSIEKRFCAGLGFTEHQRVSAVHHDTDHLHLHISINKIHPTRHTMHEPYQAYRTLGELCAKLEQEYGLQRVNHEPRRFLSESRATDMEQHSGIESLLGWIKRECLDEIRSAQSWNDLHQVMRDNGLELRERGNGLVIEAAGATMVKASTVARDLSKPKLEARLGPFEASPERQVQPKRQYQKRPVLMQINTVELYARYKVETQNMTATRANEWQKARNRKDRLIEAVKRADRLRRVTIKIMGGTRLSKKLLYAQAHRARWDDIQAINKQYQKERQALYGKYQRRTWADWLKHKALDGDSEALAALRAREAAHGLKGNTIKGKGKSSPGHAAVVDNITKKGTIIYLAGMSAVRDDGDKLQVSREATPDCLQTAIRLAMERYGNRITVNGTDEFKEQSAQAAATSQLPITFADPALERRRQLLTKENIHEQSERQQGRGRDDSRGAGRAGSRPADAARSVTQAGIAKPNISRVGGVPPPQSQYRLRTLSQLSVVRIASGSEVLLSRDVPDHVEQQGTKPDNALRRRVSRARVTPEQLAAADKYIAEREEKRLKFFDIPKHIRYNDSNDALAYAGIRNVEGHTLALLKRGEEVMVLPIDVANARRLKRLALGVQVTVTSKGSVKTKGRSR